MKLLVDMNLSPDWVPLLERQGHECAHWSRVGKANATDAEILEAARASGCIVFTHDLDFGRLLALGRAKGPSVIQVRTQDVSPAYLGNAVVAALQRFQIELEQGALVVVDEARSRVRVLPLV